MSNNIKPCNICGSNSSVLQFCDKCKVQCCELCLGEHKHNKVCSLIVKHLGPTDGSCEIHLVPYNKFCLKCGILICPLCLRSHCEHIDDVVSLIHAVKKIRREIPTLVKSLSAKITNAHHAVTARQAEVKKMQSVKKNIEVEERIWNEIIVERADSLYRQINQKITDLDNDGILQQQYMRKIGKTIDTIKSVEIVKYSSTFVLLWVCVNKELFQIDENEKAKSLLESIIFQSGIKDHSNICNIFGCLKSVRKDDEIDEVTSEMFAKLKIDDQAKVDSKPDTVDICTKSVVSSEEIGEEDVTSRELEELQKEYDKIVLDKQRLEVDICRRTCQYQEATKESKRIAEDKAAEIQRLNNQIQKLTNSENAVKEELRHELRNIKKGATETFNKNEKLREEKSKIFKQLCILQDSVTQTTDQSQDRFHQTIKFTDEKPISKVFDVIQTNVSYLNENLLRLQDEIRSKEKTVKTQGEQINELQQQSFQSEIEKRKISEKLEIVCKEKEDLRKLRVLGNNISLEEERITEQEKTYNKNIIDLQQKTQQLEAEKDILLEKYKGVCKERDGFKDGSIFKDEIRAKEEVITKHDDTMEELEKRLQQLGTEKDSMLASYEKVCKEKDELINRSILTEKKLLKEKTAIERALDDKIRDLQQELQQLKLEKDSCLKKYVNVCKEKEDLIEGSKSIQLSFEEYEGRIENLERSLKEKEKELHNKSQEYLHQLNGKDSCILELNKVGNRHMANISDKEKTITFLQGEKDHLQTRQQGLINQLNQKDKTVLEINRMLNHQKKIISDKDETIRVMKKEKDDLQTRLSSVAGEKLTKGNPSITDLGDPNRPMKIGEKYGELYDNEWTDAMEHIIEVKKSYPDMKESEIEEIIIRHLHRLLKCCYKECIMKAEEQIHKLGESLAETMCFTFKSKDEIASLPVCKEALVLRRAKSEEFAKFLFQNQGLCKNVVTDWDYINKNENVMQILTQSTFFEKCVYLCWCMAIQDPVMYLDDDIVPFSPIDKNTYKEFVKSGNSVAYVVWPALFLNKDGPLLYKGVVQAYWKKDDDDNMEGTRV